MSVPWSQRQESQTGNQPERYWSGQTLKDTLHCESVAVEHRSITMIRSVANMSLIPPMYVYREAVSPPSGP